MGSAFDEMIELAAASGLKIRHVRLGGSGGGVATLRGERILFLDVDADAADQVEMLARALAGQAGVASRFVRPDVRALLDRYGGE